MQKRNRSKSEAKNLAILEAAGDLFLELGFETTSMDRVAQQAGVSKQTVYSHFQNKEALFAAVLESKCEEYGLRADLFDPTKNCKENLLTFARQLNDLLSSAEAVKVDLLCSSNAEERPDLALLYYESGASKIRELLKDYFSSQVQAGTLQIVDVELAASLFLHLSHSDAVSFARWGVPGKVTVDTADYLETAIDMFLQYFQHDPLDRS